MTRLCALLIAMALSVAAVFMAAKIVRDLANGITDYSASRGWMSERVTRAASPDKFRDGMLMQGGYAALFGGIASISFIFYRRLGDSGD